MSRALEKRNSKAKKPKPHKKYTPLHDELEKQLADREAAVGFQACNGMDLETCEKQIAAAKAFATTTRVRRLEALLREKNSQLVDRFSAALKLAETGGEEDALRELQSLLPFSDSLPGIEDEMIRIRRVYCDSLIRDGQRLIEFKNWESAEALLERASKVSPNNEQMQTVQDRLERGRRAYELALQAETQLQQESFEAATMRIREALQTYPEGAQDLEPIRQRIAGLWVDQLALQMEIVTRNPHSFGEARDTVNTLDQISGLDPGHPILESRWNEASERLGSSSLQRAMFLTEDGDPSRIGTAFALLLNAQTRLGNAVVLPSQVKDAASLFNRKRASQLILSVEDLTGAPRAFVEAVSARLQHTAESLGLPDLRIRAKKEYYEAPGEDPEFQDFRPDGKSPTALLAIGIRAHLSERWSSETPERVPSTFVGGTQGVLNPAYEAKRNELEEIVGQMEVTKDEKKFSALARQKNLAETMLAQIARIREVDKLVDYSYLRIKHRQQTRVELTLDLRDFFTKNRIEDREIIFSEVKEGIQLDGVRESDTSLVRNEPVRLPSPEQMLARAQREVLDGLEEKIREDLSAYTHRFFREGIHLLESGRPGEAAELFLCHWAFFRGRIQEEQRARVVRVVKEETGFNLARDGRDFLNAMDRVAPIAW